MERKSNLNNISLLGEFSEESRARRGNILRKVPVALLRVTCRCFVKRSLESSRRPKYLTEVFQSMAVF
jgi:hypothetical protein